MPTVVIEENHLVQKNEGEWSTFYESPIKN